MTYETNPLAYICTTPAEYKHLHKVWECRMAGMEHDEDDADFQSLCRALENYEDNYAQ